MQLADHFNVLLKDTVNLSQFKLDLLNQRVEAIYKALKADVEIGALITGKTPQGSWAHRTIINPVGDNEFDADFMLDMSQNPDWADNPKTYINTPAGSAYAYRRTRAAGTPRGGARSTR